MCAQRFQRGRVRWRGSGTNCPFNTDHYGVDDYQQRLADRHRQDARGAMSMMDLRDDFTRGSMSLMDLSHDFDQRNSNGRMSFNSRQFSRGGRRGRGCHHFSNDDIYPPFNPNFQHYQQIPWNSPDKGRISCSTQYNRSRGRGGRTMYDQRHPGAFGRGHVPSRASTMYEQYPYYPRANEGFVNMELTAERLVEILSHFQGETEYSETIAHHVSSNSDIVINVANSRKDLFAVKDYGAGPMVKLVPKISLCSDYLSRGGCKLMKTCRNLHICKTYVKSFCNSGSDCPFGHRWDTNHNNAVLCKLHLDKIERKALHQIVKKVCQDSLDLSICSFYNTVGRDCRYGDKCWQLHICKSFVFGNGVCSVENCTLNHNISTNQCCTILKFFGVSINESPRDIVMHLAIILEEQAEQHLTTPSCSGGRAENKSKAKRTPFNELGRSKEKTENENSQENADKLQGRWTENCIANVEGTQDSRCTKQSRTWKSTDVYGDVEIPEICEFSIDAKCENEKEGCKYLHAKSPFHWQFESSGNWYNFRIFHSKLLEGAYRDVSKSTVELPALHQNKLEGYAKEMLKILGTFSWRGDFKSMTLLSNDVALKIRRISTKSTAVSTSNKATVFAWYFLDDMGKWVLYDHVGSISSEYIEKQYLSNPSSPLVIRNAHNEYELDFSKMTQVNTQTDKVREIRRRPSQHSYQKNSTVKSDPTTVLPVHWSQMNTSDTFSLVPLASSSKEYQEISSQLLRTLPTANIQNIKRLQNLFLWHLLQFKKEELSKRYDENQMNVQKLFHGSSFEDLALICKENIDWRQGITQLEMYGQGTYFSNSAAVARCHCTPDRNTKYVMVLAEVVIGMIVKGCSSYTRPPSNPNTGFSYDTTVDDVAAPTLFVKYDKEEYYPEYFIEFD